MAAKEKLPLIKWVKLRTKVFRRDKYQCQYCRQFFGEDGLLLSAHHIKPRAEGGNNKLSNLITLCLKCHDRIELNPEEMYDVLAIIDIIPDKDVGKKTIIADKNDWHRWVYGGCRNPNL